MIHSSPEVHLYIIRHGQSSNNAGMARVVDPPLTQAGEYQARCVARALRSAGITDLFASPMRRALSTAARIGDTLGLRVNVSAEYCEAGGLGTHPGMGRDEILKLHPRCQLSDALKPGGWWNGDEEEEERLLRRAQQAARGLLALEREHYDVRAAVITHGTFASHLLRALLRVDPLSPTQFAHRNAAITLLEAEHGLLTLRYHNRTDHLPAHLIS